MAIDAGIYNQLKYPDPNGLSGMLDLYQQGKEHQVDRKNKLAQLAQEQEMRSIQLDEAKGRQFFQQHLQTALEHSGGDLRKARDFAFQSGHPEGVAWAQQADKFIKEQEAKDRQNQFGEVVNSIGQPSVTSNQTEMLMQGGGNPSYTSMPETPEQRQQKMLKMLSINPESGAQVAGVLNKPEEFRMNQAEARQARQDKFSQEENMARLVAGLKPSKEVAPQAQRTPLSAAAQKELFEAEDTIQSSKNAAGILAEALKLNDKAYSGYGAKARAVLRSNLPGETPEADATVNLDNMMTGQALESLKAIFGGMPTEGERKILLDMQASADKTPSQRKEIINRAIQMANTRQKYNENKAKALRDGTYFGSSPVAPDQTDVHSAADAILGL
jgi:hypothetical protein